jgi:hypothetical protein
LVMAAWGLGLIMAVVTLDVLGIGI